MKTMLCLLAASLTIAPVAIHAANSSPAQNQRAEVIFVNPDKFTDIDQSYNGNEQGRDANLSEIRRYMLKEAQRYLPAGDHLTVTVTDIDLAGDFEPQRGPTWTDVRIMKDIYPPRMDLSYQLTDSSGRVIKQGKETLVNNTYLHDITPILKDDPLKYDKTLIDDWFRREFESLK